MKKLKDYLITAAVGLTIAGFILFYKNVFMCKEAIDVFHILCDAFFVPGMLIFGFGLLVVASNGGTFDMLTYGVMRFFTFFKKDLSAKYKTFYDYRKAQQDSPRKFMFLILVGIFFIAISVIFLLIYLNLKSNV